MNAKVRIIEMSERNSNVAAKAAEMEAWVKGNLTDLKPGSDEFYQKVLELILNAK